MKTSIDNLCMNKEQSSAKELVNTKGWSSRSKQLSKKITFNESDSLSDTEVIKVVLSVCRDRKRFLEYRIWEEKSISDTTFWKSKALFYTELFGFDYHHEALMNHQYELQIEGNLLIFDFQEVSSSEETDIFLNDGTFMVQRAKYNSYLKISD